MLIFGRNEWDMKLHWSIKERKNFLCSVIKHFSKNSTPSHQLIASTWDFHGNKRLHFSFLHYPRYRCGNIVNYKPGLSLTVPERCENTIGIHSQFDNTVCL